MEYRSFFSETGMRVLVFFPPKLVPSPCCSPFAESFTPHLCVWDIGLLSYFLPNKLTSPQYWMPFPPCIFSHDFRKVRVLSLSCWTQWLLVAASLKRGKWFLGKRWQLAFVPLSSCIYMSLYLYFQAQHRVNHYMKRWASRLYDNL